MIFTIFLGILGLDLVVLVHELGHLIIAKCMGIEVEAFSIGMGKKLLSFKYGGTDYRISMFPIGGYCRMKGEEQFSKALRDKTVSIPYEEGSIFSAVPIKRIATYFAGPLFNLIFSIIVLTLIWSVGFSVKTYDNRIVLLSDYPEIFGEATNPADKSGLATGDKIAGINDKTIRSYSDLQEVIYQSPGKTLTLRVERNNQLISLLVTPTMNKDTGAGQIGVSPFVEPVVENVTQGSSAYIGGVRSGDQIISVNGDGISNYLDIYKVLKDRPEFLKLGIIRGGTGQILSLVPVYEDDGNVDLGIAFETVQIESENLGLPASLNRGIRDTFETFIMTAKSIIILFSGVDVKKAVSGPIRISYYVGEVASSSFKEGIKSGFTTIFRFLSVISVALAFANLLPIPIFDGGLILFTLIEIIRKKPIKPGIFYRYQSIGFVILIVLFFLTTYSDITFLFSK